MRAPNFKIVFRWRLLQEKKLKKKIKYKQQIMSYKNIKRFIMFYQRVTLRMIKDLSKTASVVITLKENHKIGKILYR